MALITATVFFMLEYSVPLFLQAMYKNVQNI